MGDLELDVHPLTSANFADFEAVLGPHGAYGGCWCMYWRLKRPEFNTQLGDGNRQAMKALVESGSTPGLLGCLDGRPVGWVSVAPRVEFPVLNNSRILKAVDDQPVWSVNCFYVVRRSRRMGVSAALIKAAVRFATEHGAQIVEGYPVDPRKGDYPDAYIYTGAMSAFKQAGFVEVLRRSETRPIMRFYISKASV
ncbi:MAG: GNAT family N-acetyltransferase [Anaerolineaceae bacterium]|jgi:GNAT superfamily N-acetyltransferase